MKLLQDGTVRWFDSACLTSNNPDATFTGVNVRGRIVGHHDLSDDTATHVFACVPMDTPARYIWRRFMH